MRDDLPGGFIETFLAGAQLRQPIRVDPEAKDKRLADLKDGLTARPEGQRSHDYSVALARKARM